MSEKQRYRAENPSPHLSDASARGRFQNDSCQKWPAGAPTISPPRGIWAVWWRCWRRRLAHAATGEILKWALLGPLSVGFLILAGWLFLRLWEVVWVIPVAGPVVAETLWSAFLAFVVVFLFYSHLLTTLSVFYASHDLPLLLSTPLPFGVLHRQRCVETLVRSSAMILFVLVPAMATQWVVLEAGWPVWLGGECCACDPLLGFRLSWNLGRANGGFLVARAANPSVSCASRASPVGNPGCALARKPAGDALV